MAYDAKKNFSYSLIAVAPVPAASGTTFSVTAGEGALFPAVPFNVVVWPAGANPTAVNAEVLRITSKGTGDNWTATRTQESSVARSIALGDQICAAITAKTLTDVEAAVTAVEASATAALAIAPGGRLTLTTATPVTTAEVTAATTLFYAPYTTNVIALYSGTAWVSRTFAELSIAVPATTSTMYDVFIYDNAGVATMELTAWTNDTTRATALVRQDGRLVKSGATTRRYVGSVRTTTVSGQTECSNANRLVWNAYNHLRRPARVLEGTATWTYSTNTYRQANAAATNQLAIVVGLSEKPLFIEVQAAASSGNGGDKAYVAIGQDSTTTPAAGNVGIGSADNNTAGVQLRAHLDIIPSVGYHTYVWLEKASTGLTCTWNGTTDTQSGIYGWVEG
jgi:hypothetical protein